MKSPWLYCAAKQLEVRQIALDQPGMSQTWAFFAVLNKSRKACMLRSGPVLVWSNNTKKQQTLDDGSKVDVASLYKDHLQHAIFDYYDPDRYRHKRYVLAPLTANGKLAVKDIVGFSIWNTAGDGDNWFSSISVQLPNGHGKPMRTIFKTAYAYDGYAGFPILPTSYLLQPLPSWSPLPNDCGVGSNSLINVRDIMGCG